MLQLAGSLIACNAASTPATGISATATGNCFPASVHTSREMQARVDCHPSEYKLPISKDTVILFAFPGPIVDWVGPVFIIHVPSASEAVVDYDGRLLVRGYTTSEGQTAIEAVLDDSALMARVLERAKEIKKELNPPFIPRWQGAGYVAECHLPPFLRSPSVWRSERLLPLFDHLARHLHQLMRRADGPLPHLAQHLR